MKEKLKKIIIKTASPFVRIGLKNRDYSIISNNCWGGVITRNFGLPYNSPTCGAYFFSEDYIKFCKDLKSHLQAELLPLELKDSKYKESIVKGHGDKVVLGKVLDVEIVFVHYSSFKEAKEKWDRRKKRVNFDNLIVKYNDQNLFQEKHYEEFKNLPYKNKIFFTANPKFKGEKDVVFVKKFQKDGYVLDDIKPSKKYFNVKKYLNNINKK